MDKKKPIKNIIFFTGEAATGKTFMAQQLSRFLTTNNHIKTFTIHLGDRVRKDQKEGVEPAFSFREKTDSKILLDKNEIEKLMNHYLDEVPNDTDCILVEGFPKTKDDVDLMAGELKDKYYNEYVTSLVSLSFEDQEGSIIGMQKRQDIPGKYREELSGIKSMEKKQANYIEQIKPAIEYFKEKYNNEHSMPLIELKLKDRDFFKNFGGDSTLQEGTFKELLRKLPYGLDLTKTDRESEELSKQFKMKLN